MRSALYVLISIMIGGLCLTGELLAQYHPLPPLDGEVTFGDALQPGGQAGVQSGQPPLPGSGPVSFATTSGCPQDTLQYTLAKALGTPQLVPIVSGPLSSNGYGQYYDTPEDVTVSGLTFYATLNGGPNVNSTVTLYEALPDSTPGVILAQTQVTINNQFIPGPLANFQYDVSFPTPVLVSAGDGFICAVENPSTNQMFVGQSANGDGLGEGLAVIQFDGIGWFKLNGPFVVGSPDRDIFLNPHVTYDHTAEFSFADNCLTGVPSSITFSNNSSSAIFHRMYNFNTFAGTQDQSHEWDPDFGGTTNSVNFTTTFNTQQNYDIVLNDTILGWTTTCVVSDTQRLYAPAQPTDILMPDTVCVDGNFSATAQGDFEDSFSWTLPPNYSQTGSFGDSVVTIQGADNGGDICIVADNAGCPPSAPYCEPVEVAELPVTDSIDAPVYACEGETVTISAFGTATNGFLWSVPTGWAVVSGQGTGTVQVLVGPATGDVCAEALRDTCIGSTLCEEIYVGPPQAPTINGDTEVCPYDNVSFTASLSSVTDSILWDLPSTWAYVSDSFATTLTAFTDTIGNAVTATGVNRCGFGPTTTFNLSVYDRPDTTFPVQGPTGGCEGEFMTFFTQSAQNVTGYTWLYPADWQVYGPNDATAITLETGVLEGDVCVITELFGCIGDTACTTVALDPPIEKPDLIEGERAICELTQQTFRIDSVSGAQDYTWEIPAGWGLNGGQGTNNINVSAGSQSGTICVSARNGACETPEECIYVEVGETVGQVTEIFGDPEVCFKDSVTFEVDNVQGADRFYWTWPETWTLVGGQETAILNIEGGLTFGELTVTPANAYCEGEPYSIDVISVDSPEAGFEWELLDVFEATFFDSSAGVPSDFFWDFDDGATSTAVEPEHTFPGENVYNVTLIASNKCGADTITREVPIYNPLGREDAISSRLTLYPNPTRHVLFVKGEQQFQLHSVTAIDAAGREVPLQLSLHTANSYQLNVKHLANGAYTLRLETADGVGYARFVRID